MHSKLYFVFAYELVPQRQRWPNGSFKFFAAHGQVPLHIPLFAQLHLQILDTRRARLSFLVRPRALPSLSFYIVPPLTEFGSNFSEKLFHLVLRVDECPRGPGYNRWERDRAPQYYPRVCLRQPVAHLLHPFSRKSAARLYSRLSHNVYALARPFSYTVWDLH